MLEKAPGVFVDNKGKPVDRQFYIDQGGIPSDLTEAEFTTGWWHEMGAPIEGQSFGQAAYAAQHQKAVNGINETFKGDESSRTANLEALEAAPKPEWVTTAAAPPPAEETLGDTAAAALEDFSQPPPAPPKTYKPKVVDQTLGDELAALPKSRATTGPRTTTPRASQIGLDSTGLDPNLFTAPTTGEGDPANPTGEGAPEADRTRIDPVLDSVNKIQNKLLALGDTSPETSAAEEALKKASAEADIRSAFGIESSQRSALGQARSGRSRGDRALLERGAVGEAAFIGQEGARTDALRTAEETGNLGVLRAKEEDDDRRFKKDLYTEAGSLGLNVAALEVQIDSTNIASANNYINQEFGKLIADGQLGAQYAQIDEHHAEMILGFTKDMATLQFEYDKMSVDDQNTTDALLMQKYQIDQQTMLALKQLKQAGKMDWNQLLTSVIGGAASGATAAVASDRRVKTRVRVIDDSADREFEELMGAMTANAYNYKNPGLHGQGRRFGPMAQDLEKTTLGKAMVRPHPDGTKMVDSAALSLANAGALGVVWSKLQALEEAAS
jgi:hypothetical protein